MKALQIETGFILESDEIGTVKSKAYSYNTTLVRYGLLSNFETRLGFDYLGEKVEAAGIVENSVSGFGPLYTGFKVKIADEDGCMPELAFLGGLVLPFTANDSFKPDYTAATMRFAFSHTLSEHFFLGYNLGAEWDGDSAIPGYYYSLVLGVGLSERLAMFVESYGLIPAEGDDDHQFDAGITYLLRQNLQLDASGGIGLNAAAPDYFISFGLSYRLPY